MNPVGVDELAAVLRAAVVLPVLRSPDRARLLTQVERCVGAGHGIVEVTTSTPDWAVAVGEIRAAWPELVVGVGTILEPAQAETAVRAGATFLVSPAPVPEVRDCLHGRMPLIEGGFTPGELLAASSRGIAKFFPAHVGGPRMLESVLALRPDARIVPTGGVGQAEVGNWLAAGALAVGIGAGLLDEPDSSRAGVGPFRGLNRS